MNTNMTPIKQEERIELTQLQYDILVEMDREYCNNYATLEYKTKYDKKTLQQGIKELKAMNLLEFQRGLFTEDGETAGSGWSLEYSTWQKTQDLLENFETKGLQRRNKPNE